MGAVRDALLTCKERLTIKLRVIQGYRHQEKGDVPAVFVSVMAQIVKMLALIDKTLDSIEANPDMKPIAAGPVIGAAVLMLRSLDGEQVEEDKSDGGIDDPQ